MSRHDNNKVRILNKAFGMLATLNAERGLSVAGLARRLGLPRPTVNRILNSLVHEGLVTRTPNDGLYCVTESARAIAPRLPLAPRLEAAARRELQRAPTKNPWPLFVAAMIDGHATMIAAAESHVHFLPRKAVPGIILSGASTLARWLSAPEPKPDVIEGSTGPESWAAVKIAIEPAEQACLGMRIPAPAEQAQPLLQAWLPDLEMRARSIAQSWAALATEDA